MHAAQGGKGFGSFVLISPHVKRERIGSIEGKLAGVEKATGENPLILKRVGATNEVKTRVPWEIAAYDDMEAFFEPGAKLLEINFFGMHDPRKLGFSLGELNFG